MVNSGNSLSLVTKTLIFILIFLTCTLTLLSEESEIWQHLKHNRWCSALHSLDKWFGRIAVHMQAYPGISLCFTISPLTPMKSLNGYMVQTRSRDHKIIFQPTVMQCLGCEQIVLLEFCLQMGASISDVPMVNAVATGEVNCYTVIGHTRGLWRRCRAYIFTVVKNVPVDLSAMRNKCKIIYTINALSCRCTLMILHIWRRRRNANRNVCNAGNM